MAKKGDDVGVRLQPDPLQRTYLVKRVLDASARAARLDGHLVARRRVLVEVHGAEVATIEVASVLEGIDRRWRRRVPRGHLGNKVVRARARSRSAAARAASRPTVRRPHTVLRPFASAAAYDTTEVTLSVTYSTRTTCTTTDSSQAARHRRRVSSGLV